MPKAKEMSKEEQALYNELKKLGKRANQRIVRLERAFGKDTWATRDLRDKLAIEPLQAWTKSGRVKYNKSMTEAQMKATIKATNQFLNATGISTVRGIKKARKKAVQTIQQRFSTDAKNMSYEEAETFLEIWEDTDVNGITNYLEGSDVQAFVDVAKEKREDFNTFYDKLKRYQKYNLGKTSKTGESITMLAKKIYKKYIFDADSITSMIEEAKNVNDLNEVQNIIENLRTDNIISNTRYISFINLWENKYNDMV